MNMGTTTKMLLASGAILLFACNESTPPVTAGGGGAGGGAGGSGGGSAARCTVAAPEEPAVVATEAGLVRGQKEGDIWVFRGIPYAAPPVGDKRWKAPEEAACWEGVFDALDFGAKCPQLDDKTGAVVGVEDCLNLNVFAPDAAIADIGRMPILVFIHGGGNIQGSNSQTLAGGAAIYDGSALAKAGQAVVVTINYRLGALGFLALKELSTESGKARSGNYGLLDQIAALQWVQKNAAAFGGDPKKVMVFGESAGALDTITLVASPLGKGLFQSALAESGGSTSVPLADAENAMGGVVDASSCGGVPDRLACLRGKTPEMLLAELPGSVGIGSASVGSDPSKYGPVIDGYVLPKSTMAILQAGEHNHVPFVLGTNGEELAKMLAVKVTTEAEMKAVVEQAFPGISPTILAAYPVADYASPQDALVALYSDMRFNCPGRTITRAVRNSQTEPVFRYFFTRRASTPQGQNPAAHAVELLYVFNTLTKIPLYTPAAEDLALSTSMMGYWTSFAAKGDPNAQGAVLWPPYDSAKDTHIVLDSPISSGEGVRTAQCDMWESVLVGP